MTGRAVHVVFSTRWARIAVLTVSAIAFLGIVAWRLAHRDRLGDGTSSLASGRSGGRMPAPGQRADAYPADAAETRHELLDRLVAGYYAAPPGPPRDAYVAGVAALLGNRRPTELVSLGIVVDREPGDGARRLGSDEIVARLKSRIERMKPLERARAMEFMKAVRTRLERQ